MDWMTWALWGFLWVFCAGFSMVPYYKYVGRPIKPIETLMCILLAPLIFAYTLGSLACGLLISLIEG